MQNLGPEQAPDTDKRQTEGKGSGRFRLSQIPQKLIWQGKVLPAFWTVGAFFSLMLNLILLVTLFLLGRQVFLVKAYLQDNLVGGLYYNFILLDEATLNLTVEVDDTIPVQFDMPLKQNTLVTLTEDTFIEGASVTLTTGGLNIIEAPTNISLPAGTKLPVALDLVVPVDATVPVRLSVPVSIPFKDTELHKPFKGLQNVISPLYQLLAPFPNSWQGVFCKMPLGPDCP